MKGIHKVVVGTKYLKYEFELRRNLTIIRGDSATGKTTLVDMIRTHMNDGQQGIFYFSWECYFTALLTEKTAGIYLIIPRKR
mgnify:CR=1 FL=1|jgi:predicted ATPase